MSSAAADPSALRAGAVAGSVLGRLVGDVVEAAAVAAESVAVVSFSVMVVGSGGAVMIAALTYDQEQRHSVLKCSLLKIVYSKSPGNHPAVHLLS